MVEKLSIYTLLDNGTSVPFPQSHIAGQELVQAAINTYTFTAGRMGSTNIQATLMYPICLDNYWTQREYIEFKGERYFIFSTPTSSKSNDDLRYKHELNFVSERIILDNTYFFDVVADNATDVDQFVSNSTKFTFFGDISEFAKRLNYSLKYSKVGYSVVVDSGISSEGKLMSFEDKYFSEVLQEIFNIYELPYYFVGKVIHVGYTSNAITHEFKYGYDRELLSIKKANANYKIVNRCTGVGSSENIPYYYPNDHAKGDVQAIAGDENVSIKTSDISIINNQLYQEKVSLGEKVEYKETDTHVYTQLYISTPTEEEKYPYSQEVIAETRKVDVSSDSFKYFNSTFDFYAIIDLSNDTDVTISFKLWGTLMFRYLKSGAVGMSKGWQNFSREYENHTYSLYLWNASTSSWVLGQSNIGSEKQVTIGLKAGTNRLKMSCSFTNLVNVSGYFIYTDWKSSLGISAEASGNSRVWFYNNNPVTLSNIGISISKIPSVGDYFYQKQIEGNFIMVSQNLMPPIYRETNGAERFYNAKNNTYKIPGSNEYYDFENEYVDGNPKEQIVSFENIKPTIKNIVNADNKPFGEILDVAFDEDDNDEIDAETNAYKHPYFYIKLNRFDGNYGFNLFDQGIVGADMTISMTSGACAACNFVISVLEVKSSDGRTSTFKNPVQVDDDGNILSGNQSDKWNEANIQQVQQNTVTSQVWLRVSKDDSTFGVVLPSNNRNYKPKAGDTFVLTNIDLPKQYILNAENELKEAIIKYMAENNSEKFNFSINFKRIFFAEYPEVLAELNENARLLVEYDGIKYTLYVNNYTYKVNENEILPEITVELADTITVRKGSVQQSIDAVKQDIMSSIGSIDFLKMGLKYFIRKDVDDSTEHHLVIKDGLYVTRESDSGVALQEGDSNSIQEGDVNAIQEYSEVSAAPLPTTMTLGELDNVNSVVDGTATEDVFLVKKAGSSEWTQETKSSDTPSNIYTTNINFARLLNKTSADMTATERDELNNIISKIDDGYIIAYDCVDFDTGRRYAGTLNISYDSGSYVMYFTFTIGSSQQAYVKAWLTDRQWVIDKYDVDVSSLPEAPKDGKTYGRKDGSWVEVTSGGVITIDDRLSDTSVNPVQNKVITMNINEILDEVFKLSFKSFSGGGVYEKGRIITPSISWSLEKKGQEVNPTAATVNGSTDGVSSDLKSFTSPSFVQENISYNVVCKYETQQVSRAANYTFQLKKYWGVSPNITLTNEEILALNSTWASRTMGKTTFDCTGGRYIYYIIPSSIYGNGVEFWVGGLYNSDVVVSTMDVTNSFNVTENYTIMRLRPKQMGVLSIEIK